MADQHALDDAAAAALMLLRGADREHLGLLYEQAGIQATPTAAGAKSAARGAFKIPKGSLRGLFHNHPLPQNPGRARAARRFSHDDITQADKLGVPSYILVGDEVRRYKPGEISDAGAPVLAQFPIEQVLQQLAQSNPLVAAALAQRGSNPLAAAAK